MQVNALAAFVGGHPAHQLGGRHPLVLAQLFQQGRGVLRVDGHHEAARGLGVVEQVLKGQLGLPCLHPVLGEVAVAVHSGRQQAQTGQLQGLGDEGDAGQVQVKLSPAPLGHFKQMAQHAKAGNVSAGVDPVVYHNISGVLIEGHHQALGKCSGLLIGELALDPGGEHSDAHRLGVDQHIAGLGPGVGQEFLGMDKPGDRHAVLGFLVVDAVAPGDNGSCLVGLFVAAPQNGVDRLLGHVFGHCHNVEGQLRLAAHGVHIGQGVGRGDGPKGIGIVGDGGKEVHRLHQSQLVG